MVVYTFSERKQHVTAHVQMALLGAIYIWSRDGRIDP